MNMLICCITFLISIPILTAQILKATHFNIMMGEKIDINIIFPKPMFCLISITNISSYPIYELETFPHRLLYNDELFQTIFKSDFLITIIYYHFILIRQNGYIFHIHLCNLTNKISFYDRHVQPPKPMFIIYENNTMKMNNFDINDQLVFYCIGNQDSKVKFILPPQTKYYDNDESSSYVVKSYVIATENILDENLKCIINDINTIMKNLTFLMKKTTQYKRNKNNKMGQKKVNDDILETTFDDSSYGYTIIIIIVLILFIVLVLCPSLVYCIFGTFFRVNEC